MPKLIEAPDLTKRSNKTRLIEAPSLTPAKPKETIKDLRPINQVAGRPKLAKDNELSSIRGDISELYQTLKQLVKAEVDLFSAVTDLSEKQQRIVNDISNLTSKVKEISDAGINKKTIEALKEDIDNLFDDIGKLGEEVTRVGKGQNYMTFGGGISRTEAVAAVKADGDIALLVDSGVISVPGGGMKKVSSIQYNPETNKLRVVYKGD